MFTSFLGSLGIRTAVGDRRPRRTLHVHFGGNDRHARLATVVAGVVAHRRGGYDDGVGEGGAHRQSSGQLPGNGDDAPFAPSQIGHLPHVGRDGTGIGDGHAAADDAGVGHADRHDVGDDHAGGEGGGSVGEDDGVGDG